MSQLTFERCEKIFRNQSFTNYLIQSPSFLEIDIDPAISQGILEGTSLGIQVTSKNPNTNNGIIAAQRIASTWGRTNLHISRTDLTSDALGFQYTIHTNLPDFIDEFFQVTRPPGPIKYGFLSQTD